ncbi:MAG TPA: amidohydrolase family protein [Acidobacteriaceae bacterium]|nr:amidohydrolase family protein [Acidobacteriaceae bacterium]
MNFRAALLALTLISTFTCAPAQRPAVDPQLAREIDSIHAIDNHAHPMLSPPADSTDREFDALPVDSMAPQTDPVALRPDWPPLTDAWRALFDIDLQPPIRPDTQKLLDAARARVKAREGEHYSSYILDKSNIGTMVANRVAMGTGVEPPRFLWVPYEDALLFPLNNAGLAADPDRAQFFALEDKLRARYLRERGWKKFPPTLGQYVGGFILPTLRRQHDHGAIAAKFELAYLRSLAIGNPTPAQAEAVYARYINTNTSPDPATYKPLQDYLFRVIAVYCGQLGMPVHLHSMAGAGSYFSITGGSPMNLEPLLNDPGLRQTNFVFLHGGWPFVHEIGAMLEKPNVYLDISQQALVIPAATLATWLREWLELFPDKVLFGTDGYPYSPSLGWEESTWLAARNARNALTIALSGMERDGEITPARASQLAHMVLHDNAAALYHIK